MDIKHLVSLNRADIFHLKNKMQNQGFFPDHPKMALPKLPYHSDSQNKRFAMDPRKFLEDFGWDTFKFALALKANPNSGKTAFLNRIKRSKAFTNKIWNASRYVIMNLKGDEDSPLEVHQTNTADKWFLHRLNSTIDQINQYMDQSLFADVGRVLYQFFRHEFCDWYLEFSKADIQNRETRKTLKISLLILLRCLHPFIPFLTEEIHSKMNSNRKLLMEYTFPQLDSQRIFLREHLIIEHLKALISKTRKIKSENNLPPGKMFRVYIMINSPGIKNDIKSNLKYYGFLIPNRKIEIVDNFTGLPRGFRAEIQNMKILLPLENETERKTYLEKITKDFKQNRARIIDFESRLSDPQFVKQESELAALKRSLLKLHKIKEKIQNTIADLR